MMIKNGIKIKKKMKQIDERGYHFWILSEERIFKKRKILF